MLDDNEEMMAWLEEQGALEWSGMDETGDRVLRVNPEKMKEVYPELYQAMEEDIAMQIDMLYQMGLVEVSLDDDLNEYYSITEDGRKLMAKYGYDLEEDENND